MDRLDGIDEQILAELAQHARATFAEIGERVNLSAPAVKRRVDRMLDSGVIRGFTTVIDRSAVGWNTEAYVQVYCHGRISPDELRRAWIDIPEVVSAATATGTADAILRVLAHDMRHLEDALERIRTSADIDRPDRTTARSNARFEFLDVDAGRIVAELGGAGDLEGRGHHRNLQRQPGQSDDTHRPRLAPPQPAHVDVAREDRDEQPGRRQRGQPAGAAHQQRGADADLGDARCVGVEPWAAGQFDGDDAVERFRRYEVQGADAKQQRGESVCESLAGVALETVCDGGHGYIVSCAGSSR